MEPLSCAQYFQKEFSKVSTDLGFDLGVNDIQKLRVVAVSLKMGHDFHCDAQKAYRLGKMGTVLRFRCLGVDFKLLVEYFGLLEGQEDEILDDLRVKRLSYFD